MATEDIELITSDIPRGERIGRHEECQCLEWAINTTRQVDKNYPSFFVSRLLWKQAHKREGTPRRSKISGSLWNCVNAFGGRETFARKCIDLHVFVEYYMQLSVSWNTMWRGRYSAHWLLFGSDWAHVSFPRNFQMLCRKKELIVLA